MDLKATLSGIPAFQDRQRIPPEKRKGQWIKTLVGGAVFLGAFFLPKYLGFPWQAAAVVAAFGGWIGSQQLVLTFLKAIPQAIGAVVLALSGKVPPRAS